MKLCAIQRNMTLWFSVRYTCKRVSEEVERGSSDLPPLGGAALLFLLARHGGRQQDHHQLARGHGRLAVTHRLSTQHFIVWCSGATGGQRKTTNRIILEFPLCLAAADCHPSDPDSISIYTAAFHTTFDSSNRNFPPVSNRTELNKTVVIII